MARKVSSQELIALGVDAKEAERLATELSRVKPRSFKYTAMLTEEQAQDAATATGVPFERSSLARHRVPKKK